MQTALHEQLRIISQRHGARVAVEGDGYNATYSVIWEEVQNLAAFLQREGRGAAERVLCVLGAGVEYAIAEYATHASGRVFVGVDPRLKVDEIARRVQHCEATWLVVSSGDPRLTAFRDAVPAHVQTIDIPRFGSPSWSAYRALLGNGRVVESASGCDADQLASIQYTSGTTRHPKAVMLSHGNLSANTEAIIAYLELTERDSVLSVLPLTHSYGSSVLHTHLSVGAKVVFPGRPEFPSEILRAISQKAVTGFSCVPTTTRILIERGNWSGLDFSHLRYVTQAGSRLPEVTRTELARRLPGARLFVMYGQTEATARITYLPPEDLRRKDGSVGVPIDGVAIQITDRAGVSLEAGHTGQIRVRGRGVMMGYLDNPEATAEALQDGWLVTGDLGYLDAEGYLYLVGRESETIKSGGHRIHPSEIDEVIESIAGVEGSVTVGTPDDLLGEKIVSFVQRIGDIQPSKRQVLAECARRLPRHMVPKRIVFLEALPRAENGKILRAALRESVSTSSEPPALQV